MNKVIVWVLWTCLICSCQAQPEPTDFSAEAKADMFLDTKGDNVTWQSILEKHQGKTLLIDVWATWCRDCIVGMPDVKALQEAYPNVVYVFVSMDKSQKSWKNGIHKYTLEGEHYFMAEGWDSAFSEFLDLDWIPRYLVVDADSKIALFRAVKVTDPNIKKHLK